MLTVVIGGSGSGKSEYAENLAVNCPNKNKLYLATMEPYGEEAKKRIQRHHKLRFRKGFQTIECYRELERIKLPEDSAVLLECMSNLTANEMFSQAGRKERIFTVEAVKRGVGSLAGQAENLIIVTNNVFEDGFTYDEDTREYMRVLGSLNQWLCSFAEEVAEIVHGIPIFIRKKTDF